MKIFRNRLGASVLALMLLLLSGCSLMGSSTPAVTVEPKPGETAVIPSATSPATESVPTTPVKTIEPTGEAGTGQLPESTATAGPVVETADLYLDDRSTPTGLIQSYFNAVNRKEYLRAYSYWRNPHSAVGSFEQFQRGYQDTRFVSVSFGQVGGDAGAGQMYYSAPVRLDVQLEGGGTQSYVACYILHLGHPGAQTPPFTSLSLDRGYISQEMDDADPAQSLEFICSTAGFPEGNPLDPLPETVHTDASRDNYLDDRSGPVQVLLSLFNAVNRKEYARAYSYWENTGNSSEVQPFEQFESGYAMTENVEVLTGEITGDAGAGQFYYAVPVVLKAQTTGGELQTFSGCYILHIGNPGAQASLPFRPMAVRSANIEQVHGEADVDSLLGRDCP